MWYNLGDDEYELNAFREMIQFRAGFLIKFIFLKVVVTHSLKIILSTIRSNTNMIQNSPKIIKNDSPCCAVECISKFCLLFIFEPFLKRPSPTHIAQIVKL